MALTAQILSKRAARGKDVDTVVQELLQMVDEKLSHHPVAWGRNVVPYELPTTFASLPNMDKRSSQRIIYSSVINSLKKRGFEVAINLDKGVHNSDQTMIYIAWTTVLAQSELDAMNKIITDCIVKGTAVSKFIKGEHEKKSNQAAKKPSQSTPAPNTEIPSWAVGATVPPGANAAQTSVTQTLATAINA